ncbi:MAG TPA: vitamin K epoxide reductase family protein [Limnochordia bacterium]|nr:vitamin K epoxide reductase family protein [Limnochordia bacterium]
MKSPAVVWLGWFIVAAALGGLAVCVAFIRSANRAADQGARCAPLARSRQAQLFGVPNVTLGLAYYLMLAVAAASGRLHGPVLLVAAWVAAGTVALGAYLVYALVAVLKRPCPLCFSAHAINALLTLLLIWLVRLTPPAP